MRFLKALVLVLSTIAFVLSSAVFVLSYSAISSVSPSLVMDLAETVGTEEIIDTALDRLIQLDDLELRTKVMSAVKASLPEKTLRDLTDQAISGLRRYLDAGGTGQALLIDLKDLKATFMDEIRKTYDGPLDDIEIAMEEIPDRVNLSELLRNQDVTEISRPYKIVTNMPATSATVAVAAGLLMCLTAGMMPGLRVAGWTLALISCVVFIATFVAPNLLESRLADAVASPTIDLPLGIEPAALMGRVSGFLFARARIVSAIAAVAGAALLALHSIMKRRAAPQPTA